MVSNVLWIAWAIPNHGYALLILQLGLTVMNIRGERRNDPDAEGNKQ